METGGTESLHFWSHFDPTFLPEDSRNRKKYIYIYIYNKTLAIGLSKYLKIRAPFPLPFPGKIRLLFALFWLFLTRKPAQFQIAYLTNTVPGHFPVKTALVPALSIFAAIGAKYRFCNILTHFFKFGCFSQY